jgi:high-affinity iron transporter
VEEGSQKNTYSLGDVTQLLQGSATDIEKDDIDSAVDKLNEILTI